MSASAPNDEGNAPTWLHDKVYSPKRKRTLHLVTQAIQALAEKRQSISLASISHKSKELDPSGTGVSPSAILTNPAAYAVYDQHRSWNHQRRRTAAISRPQREPVRPVASTRDVDRVRQRYMRLTKKELVDRLLQVEQAHSEQEERWLRVNEELLTWQLRARTAEAKRKS